MKTKLLIICILFSYTANAADSLLLKLDIKASFIASDHYSNLYLINEKNEIVKYDFSENKLFTYSNKQLGTPTCIDATNPLKLLVLYPDFNTLVYLDNTLSILNTITLNKPGTANTIYPITACKQDGSDNIWLYDELSRSIIQIDEIGNIITSSEPFEHLFDFTIQNPYIIANSTSVYLYDPVPGILVFDIFGSYIKTYDLFPETTFQVYDNTITYLVNDTLILFDTQLYEKKAYALPISGVKQLTIQKDIVFMSTPDAVFMYKLSNN